MSRRRDPILTATEQAATELASRPSADLLLGTRRLIWRSIGKRLESPADRGRSQPHIRRYSLAKRAVEKVLPMWDMSFPTEKGPHLMIQSSRDILDRRIREKQARALWEENWHFVDDLADKHDDPAIAVGYAACQLIQVATCDELFEPTTTDWALTDQDVQPVELDSAFCACAAYARGAIWDDGSSANLRREFWNWWIATATVLTESK